MFKNKMPARNSAIKVIITTACVFIILAGLRFASPIVIPFLLALFLAIVSSRPLYFLKKKGIPSLVAFLIVIIGISIISGILIIVIGNSLNSFIGSLPEYEQLLQDKQAVFLGWLDRFGISIEDKRLLDDFNPAKVMTLVANMLRGISRLFGNAFVIVLLVIFLLLEASSFPVKIRQALRSPEVSISAFDTFVEKVQRYLMIKTYISLTTGFAISIWLLIIGFDYPFLMGLLAFVLNYIPNIGSLLAAVPAILISLIKFGFGETVLVFLGYLVINILIGSIIEPRVMGKGMGLSPLVVFLSLLTWGWLFGPVGMLLSVPLTMLLKLAFESNEETRWIAILLGPAETASNSQDTS